MFPAFSSSFVQNWKCLGAFLQLFSLFYFFRTTIKIKNEENDIFYKKIFCCHNQHLSLLIDIFSGSDLMLYLYLFPSTTTISCWHRTLNEVERYREFSSFNIFFSFQIEKCYDDEDEKITKTKCQTRHIWWKIFKSLLIIFWFSQFLFICCYLITFNLTHLKGNQNHWILYKKKNDNSSDWNLNKYLTKRYEEMTSLLKCRYTILSLVHISHDNIFRYKTSHLSIYSTIQFSLLIVIFVVINL